VGVKDTHHFLEDCRRVGRVFEDVMAYSYVYQAIWNGGGVLEKLDAVSANSWLQMLGKVNAEAFFAF
jgi:hypothetical protein